MYKVLLATEPPLTADELRTDLRDAGVNVVAENHDPAQLATAVVKNEADLVIAATASPSSKMFEAANMLGTLAPCPFIVFTSDSDASKIEKASSSHIHTYIVNGYAKHRLLSIIQVARARFRHEQIREEEFSGLSKRFEERKIVDRAKGILMRSRGIAEEESFELLRNLAMNARQRIGVAAQSVIDMSRAGEAVNRSGQLRMLSQRIVKCYIQASVAPAENSLIQNISDCVGRVESNLGILDKAISTRGYGDLVQRVAASWKNVRVLCTAKPELTKIDQLDRFAEEMLLAAEQLTEFLESSGLAPTLRILNVSGRQRMLSQRIAKMCFFLAIEPDASRLSSLRKLMDDFQAGLNYLLAAPLSSADIRKHLDHMTHNWSELTRLLQNLGEKTALKDIGDATENLLNFSESLTDQYELAMQILIGDRMGRIH